MSHQGAEQDYNQTMFDFCAGIVRLYTRFGRDVVTAGGVSSSAELRKHVEARLNSSWTV